MAIFIVAWMAVGVCAALIAGSKGRNLVNWLALGALLGPMAMLAACLAPSAAREEARSPAAVANRICPHCSNRLSPRARMCRWCKRIV
mgnify:CR=1 FL=1